MIAATATGIVQHQEYLSQYLFGKEQRAQITNGGGVAMRRGMSGMLHTNYYCGVTPRPKRRMHRCRIHRSECTVPNTFRKLLLLVDK